MQARDSSHSDDETVEPANKDNAATTEKERLLQEIRKLRCIIKQCEWDLQTRFKDVERSVTERALQSLEVSSHPSRMPNVEVDLQNDLYTFAGLRCIKSRRDEFVFNFTSTNAEQKDTSAVQIFIKDRKGNLGKWVMPMSVDMNYILSKTPIDELRNITGFIKNCKHNIDCYTVRQEQFLSLKKCISNMKHCTLQSDLGLKQINLELFGVRDNENDRYINLIIHLLYHSEKARPYKIEVDSMNKSKLSDDVKQRLKICLKEFKISDLQTAFDKILAEDNSTFTWMHDDDTESPLELNDTSNSDEESLFVQLQSDRKRSLRKRQKMRELQRRWTKRRRQQDIKDIESSDSQENSNSHSKAKISRIESQQRIPIQKKKTETGRSILKQGKINKNLLEETTPVHKSKVKLKQTKLNFHAKEITNSDTNEISLFESKLRNRPDIKQLKTTKLITSTPLHANVKNISLSPGLEINNITSIETHMTRKTTDKLDDSKNSDQLDDTKTQERSERRLLRKSKNTGLSSQVLKKNLRFTRSMTKS